MQFSRVKKKKEAIVNNFVHSDSNYGSLLWHFSCKKSEKKKVENSSRKVSETCITCYCIAIKQKNPNQCR